MRRAAVASAAWLSQCVCVYVLLWRGALVFGLWVFPDLQRYQTVTCDMRHVTCRRAAAALHAPQPILHACTLVRKAIGSKHGVYKQTARETLVRQLVGRARAMGGGAVVYGGRCCNVGRIPLRLQGGGVDEVWAGRCSAGVQLRSASQ